MNKQRFYPEIVEISYNSNKKIDITKESDVHIEIEVPVENFLFKIDVDTTRFIGQGSFGTVFPCKLNILSSDNKIISENKDLVIKLIKNKNCVNDSKMKSEILIQLLLYNTRQLNIPSIYKYLFNINVLTRNPVECLNGILLEKIDPTSTDDPINKP